jgi:hypothetical protein
MPQLFLPLVHTESDLVLAGQVAELIDSAELYVTWTPEHGHAAPEVIAVLRDPVPHWTDTLALVFQAVRELWTGLLSREPRRAQLASAPAPGQPTQPKPAAG